MKIMVAMLTGLFVGLLVFIAYNNDRLLTALLVAVGTASAVAMILILQQPAEKKLKALEAEELNDGG